MFKNLTVFRIGTQWQPSPTDLENGLDKSRFVPCGASQPQSSGWVEPRGSAHAPLLESIDGQWLMKFKIEQRVLPGAVVKRRTEEIARQIEEETGRKPGKKLTKEIKEQATQELLPKAFTKQSAVNVWIDPQNRFLVLDCTSQNKSEEIIASLVKHVDGFAVSAIQTALSPSVAMTEWLLSGEPPADFTVDRECELKSTDEMKSVVRYARHLLDTEEVRQHIISGKVATRLALTWNSRVSFMLTESLQIKKLAFLDVVFEGQSGSYADKDEAFDADAAITTGELRELIPDLLDVLGGELPGMGSEPAPATIQHEPAPTSATTSASDDSPPW